MRISNVSSDVCSSDLCFLFDDDSNDDWRLSIVIIFQALGKDHPVTIEARNQLASVLRAIGNKEEADIVAPAAAKAEAAVAAPVPAKQTKQTPVASAQNQTPASDRKSTRLNSSH